MPLFAAGCLIVAAYAACLRVGLEGSGVSLRLLQLLTATPNACAGRGECVRAHCGSSCGRLAAADGGKCALCVALRWRAARACCARVRVGFACASVCAARAPPVCAVCCTLLRALFVQL